MMCCVAREREMKKEGREFVIRNAWRRTPLSNGKRGEKWGRRGMIFGRYLSTITAAHFFPLAPSAFSSFVYFLINKMVILLFIKLFFSIRRVYLLIVLFRYKKKTHV
jgi:hypothetical protein